MTDLLAKDGIKRCRIAAHDDVSMWSSCSKRWNRNASYWSGVSEVTEVRVFFLCFNNSILGILICYIAKLSLLLRQLVVAM